MNLLKNINLFKKENIFSIFLVLLTFFLDRFTKKIIIQNFQNESFYINDFLNIDLIWNTGIGFGLLSFNSDIFYNLISLIIFLVIIFLIFIIAKLDKYEKIVFSMVIGGALGNFYDRIVFKAVPDFIDLHYENFHWFTFNIADIFITIGILFYLLIGLVKKK